MTANTTAARARVDRLDGPMAAMDSGDLGWGVLYIAPDEFVCGGLVILVCGTSVCDDVVVLVIGVSVGGDLRVLVWWGFGVLVSGGTEVPFRCGLGASVCGVVAVLVGVYFVVVVSGG